MSRIPQTIGLVAAGVLLALAGLHVYWAAGGRWGASAAVPWREGTTGAGDGRPLFRPKKAATLLVALLLFLGAAILSGSAGLFGRLAPGWLFRGGTGVLALVFLARAIGDFRWFGLFKRQAATRFAALDSALYTPLCLGLAAACVVVALAI